MKEPKIIYDPDVDSLYIQIDNSKGLESEEIANGIILDYDQNNKIIGIEILKISRTTY